MNEYFLFLIAAVLAVCSTFITGQAQAAAHPYEFHADARMVHANYGVVDKAYGYMYVETDRAGRGTISVMFSNGNENNWARFNARVKFLNASGRVIKEEMFETWLDAADLRDANERRVTRALDPVDFDSVQVDFYLSDVSDRFVAATVGGGKAVH